jgi:phage terminase large subunit
MKATMKLPPLFHRNYTAKKKWVVNQGGTSSGKTYNINLVLLFRAIQNPGFVITVVGQDMPNLKKGALRDMTRAMYRYPYFKKHLANFNKSESILTMKNGSIIEFVSFEDEQDAKNGKRDIAFFNEANGIPYHIAWQIIIRTSTQCYFDYNPTSAFWVHDHIIPDAKCETIYSDHRDNPYLSDQQHEEIESISDPELWRVYARGKTGNIQGIIYPQWQICDSLPDESDCVDVIYGLDLGYTTDPTAPVKIMFADRNTIYLQELGYQPGLSGGEIKEVLEQSGYREGQIVYMDHDKTMRTELRRLGIQAIFANKNMFHAILAIRHLTVYYLRSSEHIHYERSRYKFTNVDGAITKEPDKRTPHHTLDAIRYGVFSHMVRMGWIQE